MIILDKNIKECYLTEMATSLSDFIKHVDSLAFQIIENWCLVKLCDDNIDNDARINRNHWASELKAHLKSISRKTVKSGKKIKAIKHVMIENLEFDNPIEVADAIRFKFNKEGLQKYVNVMSFECALNINDICKQMASSDCEIDEYVSEPIG